MSGVEMAGFVALWGACMVAAGHLRRRYAKFFSSSWFISGRSPATFSICLGWIAMGLSATALLVIGLARLAA